MALDTDFALWELDVLDRDCPACGRMMHICDHRYRRLHTLEGPVQLVCKLNDCPDRDCPGHAKTKSPEQEASIAPPIWAIGWDVFCWIGHRRCSRHMSVPLMQSELLDDYGIKPSDDAIAKYIQRLQVMLAARQQDPEALHRQYESYRTAREPPSQCEAVNRRKIMRKTRSKKKRPLLLAELEKRYRETPNS